MQRRKIRRTQKSEQKYLEFAQSLGKTLDQRQENREYKKASFARLCSLAFSPSLDPPPSPVGVVAANNNPSV